MGTNRLGMRPFWVDAIIWEGFWSGCPSCESCWPRLYGLLAGRAVGKGERSPGKARGSVQIAENKGIRIKVSDSIPVKEIAPVPENPLAKFTTTELMAEIDRRKTA